MNLKFEKAVAERKERERKFDAEREKLALENIEKVNDFINQHDAKTAQSVFQSLIEVIEIADLLDKDKLLQSFRDACSKITDVKFVYYMQLLRIAITGQLVGANMLDVLALEMLTKQEIISRLLSYKNSFSFERIKEWKPERC